MFRVRWEDTALNELTNLWLQAASPFRQVLTAAAHEIDRQLGISPYELGESRPEGRRIHFVYPLGLIYRIEQDEQTVSVLHVWQVRRGDR